MNATLRSWTEADFAVVRPLMTHASLARAFSGLNESGLEDLHADPMLERGSRVLVEQGGAAVGFGYALVLGAEGGSRIAVLFGGVLDPHRRTGPGSAPLAEMESRVRRAAPWIDELCLLAWDPCPDAEAFSARHGYRPVRRYWRMTRALDATLEPAWPAGVTARVYDGSDAALADWCAIYN